MNKDLHITAVAQGRLLSLDFFRGFTMFFLIAEATYLFRELVSPPFADTWISAVGTLFHHHPWNGLHPWDLVQPFFMFIVGVAMPYSFARRWEAGDTWAATFHHVLRRSALLFIFGVSILCISGGKMRLELLNVLTQLSFTYLVAFLWMRKPAQAQIAFTFSLLLLTELLYRFWPLEGYNQPFTPDHGFGAWMDMLLMGHIFANGHWVAFNAVPTTAHTMWGVLAGQLLRSDRREGQKLRALIIAGVIGVAAGYALDPVTPIIKRICTSSFVIVSGGWCLLALAFSYWLIDIKGIRRWAVFFNIVGMNSIFIYLFTNTGGGAWFYKIAKPFVTGAFGWAGDAWARVATSLVVWGMLWGLCCWLYKKRIFMKI